MALTSRPYRYEQKKNTDQQLTFEAAMAELEQLVEKMEDGDLTLDQSLQAFERAALTRLPS